MARGKINHKVSTPTTLNLLADKQAQQRLIDEAIEMGTLPVGAKLAGDPHSPELVDGQVVWRIPVTLPTQRGRAERQMVSTRLDDTLADALDAFVVASGLPSRAAGIVSILTDRLLGGES